MKKGKYRRGIFIVTYRRKKDGEIEYLLLKRKLHWKGWEFCKGGCESGEKTKVCVLRELKEETGQKAISVSTYKKSGKYKYKTSIGGRPGIIGQNYNLFSAEIKDKKIKFDKEEHSGFKWVSFDKAIKMLTFTNQRICLRIVDKGIE